MPAVMTGTQHFFACFTELRHSYGDVIPGDAFKHIFNSINNSCREADIHVSFQKSACAKPTLWSR